MSCAYRVNAVGNGGGGGSGVELGRLLPPGVSSPAEMATRLEGVGYLADDGLATAVYLALALEQPLFVEGEPGVGKTSLALALAGLLGATMHRLQCYEGIGVHEALYDWNFPRQILHMRAVGDGPAEQLERDVYSRPFLLTRPLLAALETSPSVLLVDEIDRADDEFEAFLLQVLSEYRVTIPELGTITAAVPPVVVLTSNRTREVHDALKRRCLYHWVEHPSFEREVAIVRRRVPAASEALARDVAAAVKLLRDEDLLKPPGVAESIDWTRALVALGAERLDPDRAIRTLGTVLKYREDQVHAAGLDLHSALARVVADG